MLEKTVKAAVRKRLNELGCYQFWPVQVGIGTRTVDVLGCYRGHFFGIECKAPGKLPIAHQQFTMENIEAAGGVALMIDSVEKAQAIQPEHLMGRPL